VTGGGAHTCSRAGATPFCWGNNSHGELGDGTTAERHVPTMIAVPGTTPVIDSGYTTAARSPRWARTAGATTRSVSSATVRRPGGERRPRSPAFGSGATIAAGNAFTCALDAGVVSCRGDNARGQLGIGTVSARSNPHEIALP